MNTLVINKEDLRHNINKIKEYAKKSGQDDAGTVFNKFSALRVNRVLPNYGIGYRWEFKKNVNVRLDYGFGKNGQSGFLFNINEAF